MKNFKFLLALFAIFAIILSSCEDTTKVVDTPKYPVAPSNLRATSLANNSIGLMWDASSSESDSLFAGYMLTYSDFSSTITIPKGTKSYNVTNLASTGKVYTFTLWSKFSNGNYSQPVTVNWAVATRYDKNINDEVIKVYETASNNGSGLQLFNANGNAPKSLKVASSVDWNLGIYTNNGVCNFGSPSKLGYTSWAGGTPFTTLIGEDYADAPSLDNVFYTKDLSTMSFSELAIDLVDMAKTDAPKLGGFAFVVKAQNSAGHFNYARVFIKFINSSFLQGTSPDRYIECIISYQMNPDVPYAISEKKPTTFKKLSSTINKINSLTK